MLQFRSPIPTLWSASVLAGLMLLAAPPPARALFHVAVIDEFVTSYGGDPNAQFVEIRMLQGAQNFVAGSTLAAFDASGSLLGVVYTVPTNVNQGIGLPWIMATQEFVTATGFSPDFTIPGGGLRLPTGGGMVCWGQVAPAEVPLPNNYVDCVAYGTYSGASNFRTGVPTQLDADGHSLQRVNYGGDPLNPSHNNVTDYACSNSLTPANNTGGTTTLPSTSPCPICGNNVVEPGEQCDGTSDALCPGDCLGTCLCPDSDADGIIDVQDPCTTIDTHQVALSTTLVLNKLDAAGVNGLVAKGQFKPATVTPAIDPSTNGVHLRLADSGGILYEIDVRGDALGAAPCGDTRDGWVAITKPSGVKLWKYKNKSGQLPPGCATGSARGVFSIIVQDLTSTSAATWRYLAKAKMDTLPHTPVTPVTLMHFDLALAQQPGPGAASAAAIAGECTELKLTGSPVPSTAPKPFCKRAPASGSLKTLTCHGV